MGRGGAPGTKQGCGGGERTPSLPWTIQAKEPFRCPSEHLDTERNELETHAREAGK